MNDPIEELTAKFLKGCEAAGDSERRVVGALARRLQLSHNTNREYDEALSFGDRLADRIAIFGGSWTFILIFFVGLLGWIALNSFLLAPAGKSFDEYPFIFLNLVLGMLAALQAPIIMMSQNRNASKDRLAAGHDYEVNLKAELEILALHQKIDLLRREQWDQLLAIQREQILLLTKVLEGYSPPSPPEPSPLANPRPTQPAPNGDQPA